MASLFSGGCVHNIDGLAFRKAMLAGDIGISGEGCTSDPVVPPLQTLHLFAVVCTAGQSQCGAPLRVAPCTEKAQVHRPSFGGRLLLAN